MEIQMQIPSFKKNPFTCLTLIRTAFVAALLFTSDSRAAILFEGWSKLILSGEHAGYIVERYEFDEKTKEYKLTHFLKTTEKAGSMQESLTARAKSEGFKPISYQYTSIQNGKSATIDANFKDKQMSAVRTADGKKESISLTLPPKGILSNFAAYFMLAETGIKKNVRLEYKGVIEEKGALATGKLYVAGEDNISGIPVYRVVNTIDGAEFVSLSTARGEVLGTISPTINVQTVLVPSQEEAVGSIGLNSAILTQLFGSVPRGQENELVRKGIKSQAQKTDKAIPKIPVLAPAVPTSPQVSAPTAPAVASPQTPEKPKVLPQKQAPEDQ